MYRLIACVAAAILAAGSGETAAAATSADLIVHNAQITTQNPDQPSAAAVAVLDGRIIAVGTSNEVLVHKGAGTVVIDAKRRRLIPGLIDSHSHFLRSGLVYTRELRWDGVPSLKIGLDMIREQAARTPDGEWVRVIGGWTPWQFKERRLSMVEKLNEISP